MDNKLERDFYEIEAKEQNWSLRELKGSLTPVCKERLALIEIKA